jgi:two-component system response regulator MprA
MLWRHSHTAILLVKRVKRFATAGEIMNMTAILVVEDDRDLRAALCDTLKSEGYTVSEATDIASGLAALRASLPPFVAVVNSDTPPLASLEFMRAVVAEPALEQRHRFVLIIAPAELDALILLEEIRRLVTPPLLIKPFDTADLLAAVAAAARQLDDDFSSPDESTVR